jgi:hypothetical protein
MDILKILTPEQLKSLSAEQLQAIVSIDKPKVNIKELKLLIRYRLNDKGDYKNADSFYNNVRSILTKTEEVFYLISFGLEKTGLYQRDYIKGFNIYTKEEVTKVLDDKIDKFIAQFAKYNGNREQDTVLYFNDLEKESRGISTQYVKTEDNLKKHPLYRLTQEFDNLVVLNHNLIIAYGHLNDVDVSSLFV